VASAPCVILLLPIMTCDIQLTSEVQQHAPLAQLISLRVRTQKQQHRDKQQQIM